jgi:arylsulfatase A-like enzyme
MKKVAAVAMLAALMVLATSCGFGRKGPPNVVLIVIDTLRSDHLPFYGYEKDTAPFLSSLAADGVVFERTRSTSSWTAPATASIVTSLHPIQHGVLRGLLAVRVLRHIDPDISVDRIPDSVVTIAEAMKEGGYSTWGVADNLNVGYEEGFGAGFERLRTTNDAGAESVNSTVERWSDTIRDASPYFLYIHYMDPHRPYLKRSPWYEPAKGELLDSIAAYDSEISYVDSKIKELYDRFEWGKNTIVIVTSDHGEEFLDHGGWDHARTLYDEVLRVPLLFHAPAESLSVGRVEAPTSVLDILPTVRGLAGLPENPAEQGVSLVAALRGRGELPDRAFFGDLRSPPWFGDQTLKSVVRGDYKYILTLPDTEELYDLADDPGEQDSIIDDNRELADELRAELDAFEEECTKYAPESGEVNLDEEDVKKLESLGYVK